MNRKTSDVTAVCTKRPGETVIAGWRNDAGSGLPLGFRRTRVPVFPRHSHNANRDRRCDNRPNMFVDGRRKRCGTLQWDDQARLAATSLSGILASSTQCGVNTIIHRERDNGVTMLHVTCCC